MRRWGSPLVALVLAVGCGETIAGDAGVDAGARDASRPPDGGPGDGGPPPTGCDRLDGAIADAGTPDPIADGGVIDPGAFPPAVGPGGPARTFTSAELLTQCGAMDMGPTDEKHHNTGFMLDGYLVRPWAHERGRGGLAVFEIDDPCAPVTVANVLDDRIRETHATGYSAMNGRWLATASLTGILFWDVSDITAPVPVYDMALPDVRYPDAYMRVVLSVAWQAPYLYVGAADNGIFVVDATDPRAPVLVAQARPEPRFRVGNVHVVGNLLVAMSTEAARVALFDVSVPEHVRPIAGGSFLISNGALDRFMRPLPVTAYFGMVGAGHSYHARNGLGGGGMAIYDLRTPSAPRFVGNVDAPGGDGGYVFLHEGLAFVGQSDFGCIYDVHDPAMPTEIARVTFPGDLDTITPIGNVMLVSVDDDAEATATGIFPWREAPDDRGPRVDWVVPEDGASGVAVTGRVGITFDEFVAMESVWRGSVQVREMGSIEPIDGWLSGQEGAVNFWPRAPLRPGTTYEVIVPSGGVTDVSGNATTTEFRSTFTTESCAG